MKERFYRWLENRRERRRALESARRNALMMVNGGTLTPPNKRR